MGRIESRLRHSTTRLGSAVPTSLPGFAFSYAVGGSGSDSGPGTAVEAVADVVAVAIAIADRRDSRWRTGFVTTPPLSGCAPGDFAFARLPDC